MAYYFIYGRHYFLHMDTLSLADTKRQNTLIMAFIHGRHTIDNFFLAEGFMMLSSHVSLFDLNIWYDIIFSLTFWTYVVGVFLSNDFAISGQ